MPTIEIDYCDSCGKEMVKNDIFLIYRIDFWNKVNYKKIDIDYLQNKRCALMLCSKECIGEYVSKLLNGDIE